MDKAFVSMFFKNNVALQTLVKYDVRLLKNIYLRKESEEQCVDSCCVEHAHCRLHAR